MNMYEKIYFRSPVCLQNFMISVYGLKIWKRRYTGEHEAFLRHLRATATLSYDEMHDLQNKEFLRVLEHAFNTVPYYKELLRQTKLSIEEFKTIDDIKKLPTIDKETIRKNPIAFCSEKTANKKRFILHTSGTTGKALTVYGDALSRQKHYAFWTRLREQHGLKLRMKRATFFGRIICDADSKRKPFWRYEATGNNLLFSSYHMSDENLEAYCEKLSQFKPAEIIGYASSIFILSKFIKVKSISSIRPKVIFTTADTLLPHQRKIIEEAMHCPVIDQYGCAEMSVFAAQCTKGIFHVHPEHGILEILDASGSPAASGEIGEAVCTGFVNMAMPLIRYKLGDMIRQGSGACTCGAPFPIIEEVIGRVDDILYTPDRKPLGRFSPIWKVVDGIYETQVIQNSLDSLDVYVVVDNMFSQTDRDNLLFEIRKRTGTQMDIRLHVVDKISKNTNGKFRAVISNVK